MKGERRHELQHNELAEWIIRTGKAIQPYQNLVLALVIAAAVGVIAYTWWSRNTAEKAAQAWEQVSVGLADGDLNRLLRVAEEHSNTDVGNMALVLSADLRLNAGCNQLFINKAPANEQLNLAVELYSIYLKQHSSPMLTERATFGLGRAEEARGNLDAARRSYGEVVKNWPQGAYAAMAQQRLDDLGRADTKRMYDAFAKFDPKPAYSELPKDKTKSSAEMPALPSEPMPGLPAEPAAKKDASKDAKKPAEPKKDAAKNKK